MNNFEELTNKIISDFTTITETYNPENVSRETLDNITAWVGLVAISKVDKIKEMINN